MSLFLCCRYNHCYIFTAFSVILSITYYKKFSISSLNSFSLHLSQRNCIFDLSANANNLSTNFLCSAPYFFQPLRNTPTLVHHIHRIIKAIAEHITPYDSLTCRHEHISIYEPAYFGVRVPCLEVVESCLCVIDV